MVPYPTLAIDANVQRVSLTSSAIYDCRGALCVEVVALCQAVQRTGLNTTWRKEHAHTQNTSLSAAEPAHRQHDLNPHRP